MNGKCEVCGREGWHRCIAAEKIKTLKQENKCLDLRIEEAALMVDGLESENVQLKKRVEFLDGEYDNMSNIIHDIVVLFWGDGCDDLGAKDVLDRLHHFKKTFEQTEKRLETNLIRNREINRLKTGLKSFCGCPDVFHDHEEELCEFCQLRIDVKTVGEVTPEEKKDFDGHIPTGHIGESFES